MKRHVLAVLVAINVALLVVLAALWFSPDGSLRSARWTPPAAITNDYLQMLPSLPQRQPVDTSRFLALLERPLFQLTRRPPPPPPPPSEAVQAPVDNLSTAQLSGIVAAEGGASIIITMAGKARRVRLHESVDGWTLQSIQGRSVIFAGGGQTRTLQLPRAAMTNAAGAAAPIPAISAPPIAAPPPPPAAAIEPPSTAQATAAPAAPPSSAAGVTPKPSRRSRFSSGPE